MFYDVAVIGGGAGGMAAALSAKKQGAKVVIIDKNRKLGGILNQCVHNGFGLHYFGEELTGTEYAHRFRCLLEAKNINVMLDATVMSINDKKQITVVSKDGQNVIDCQSIVYTVGCRERSAGAINLIGDRPQEVMTAGDAQKRINNYGHKVGKNVVILGSGDIGLIMARRLTYEGAKVLKVFELMPYSSGLKRNIVQCLNDYDIPLEFSTTITKVVGKRHLQGLFYAKVDENLQPIKETEKFIDCDTLLLSIGLIPETEMLKDIGVDINSITSGAFVDEYRQTNVPGIFSCGNALQVHDLVDNVSFEGEIAGEFAGKFSCGKFQSEKFEDCYKVENGTGIKFVVPNYINKKMLKENEAVKLYFRSSSVKKDATIVVKCGDKELKRHKKLIVTPGEMETIVIDKKLIDNNVVVEVVK